MSDTCTNPRIYKTSRGPTEMDYKYMDFIHKYICENENWPTYREIADQFNQNSANAAAERLYKMERLGWVEQYKYGCSWRRTEKGKVAYGEWLAMKEWE